MPTVAPRPAAANDPRPPTLAEQAHPPAVWVKGRRLTQLPADLYIPPDALEVFLETFAGPLDLLLYLIRRQNLDILEINVATITAQYMEYVEAMKAVRFELAADYLLMASLLAEIKSRTLLPRPPADAEDDEDPRAQLIQRLQEYERYKDAADSLDRLPRLGRDLHPASAAPPKIERTTPPPQVDLRDLPAAFADLLQRTRLFQTHQVTLEKLSTRERMAAILLRLQKGGPKGGPRGGFVPFVAQFHPTEGRLGLLVTFLAIMELLKESHIDIVQRDLYGPIHLRARNPQTHSGSPTHEQ